MKIPFYEKLIPKSIRLTRLKNKIVNYLRNIPENEINAEQKEVLNYLNHNELDVFPYEFRKKYSPENVEVFKDESLNLYYMIWEGKKLFYKNGSKLKKAKTYFNSLLMEQDETSPHRYLTNDFDFEKGDILVDVGAAEGNFSLSVIEKAKHVYLFEMGIDWIKALEATFEPWKEKVTIIQKYVTDFDSSECIKLDSFFAGKEAPTFIKADVEGAEHQIIKGAEETIKNQKIIKMAVCTYHRQTDAEILNKSLKEKGFTTHFSDKYMIFHYGKTNVVQPPYLRKGVLRGRKGVIGNLQ